MVNIFICDKNPYKAAEYLIEHTNKTFVFKSLLELCQLICSAGISNVFKPVKQCKALQDWIKNNLYYTFEFYEKLLVWAYFNIKMKFETGTKLKFIQNDLFQYLVQNSSNQTETPITAVFRYVKEYAEFTRYSTNSELPIDMAISEYKRYLEYKEEQFNKKRCNHDRNKNFNRRNI
jgi:hypothetical protein